jgi:DUF4097 and DUF4098 domain-containing protein YvlB
MRKIGLLATVIVAIALAAACSGEAAAEDVVHSDEFALATGARIAVSGENTSVKVTRAEGDLFKISAVIKGADGVSFYVLPKSEAPIRDLFVNSRLKPGSGSGSSVQITIEAPDGSDLLIDTTNGALELEGVNINESNLVTTNGPVTVRSSQGNFTANTTNGALTITGSSGTWWTQTTNAELLFEGAVGTDRVNRFKNTGGSVSVRLAGTPDLTFNIRAQGGSVSTPGADSVRDSQGLTVARYGDGAGTVEVEVAGGNVNISRTGG